VSVCAGDFGDDDTDLCKIVDEVGIAKGDGSLSGLNYEREVPTNVAHFAFCAVKLDVGVVCIDRTCNIDASPPLVVSVPKYQIGVVVLEMQFVVCDRPLGHTRGH